MSSQGKDVQKVYDRLPFDISNIDTRGRAIVGRYVEHYEDLDLSSCVFYGCFPAEIENGLCINPETFPESLLLNDQDFSGLDLKGLILDTADEIRNVDFSNANLKNAEFSDLDVHESNLSGVHVVHTKMDDCTFTDCDFSNISFDGASLDFVALRCNFENSEFVHFDMAGELDFKDCNMRSCTFASDFFTFENCDLSYSEFTGITFLPWCSDDCKTEGVTLVHCDMRGEASDYIDYSGINLSNFESISGIFEFVDFKGANLQSVEFVRDYDKTYFKHIDFDNANLEGVLFSYVKFESGVSFKNANLSYAKFQNCEGLENVDFEGADLSNAEYDKKDARYFIEADFSGKSLIGQDFSDEDNMEYIFTEADLESADFRNSYLVGVDFENANLKNANFQGATLTRCNLKNANLENANLEYTNLEWADMRGSDVSFANFTLAKYNSGTILPESITQSQIDSMTLTDAQEPRTNPNSLDSFENDIDTVFESYKYMVGNGFGGACVAAAETVFEDVLEHGNLKHPERLEIVAVWNTFCLKERKPIGHVCLRYFVGEDREDPEAYVYIDSDLYYKEYHEVESWGHMPKDMLECYFDLEEDASIIDGYGDDEEFETTTLSFSNIEDFKNSPSYLMFCNVPL